MLEEGSYILLHAGYSRDQKVLWSLQRNKEIVTYTPSYETMTIRFDRATRFCVGWHDLKTGENHVCPEQSTVSDAYDQCPSCQKRTGFNPAFYHASHVSPQQDERNLEPHLLYLAHFGKGIVKVGISYASRGYARLLEQGARSALILDTFPTAHIARQYEATIASIPGIVETVQLRKKIIAMSEEYNQEAALNELREAKAHIEKTLVKTFSHHTPLAFNTTYFPQRPPDLQASFETTDQAMISGKMIGMLGTLLFCDQQETPLFLSLKKYTGYAFTFEHSETFIPLPPRQLTFF